MAHDTSDHAIVGALDHSARAGLLLGAVMGGRSYQPNLLTRNTVDQAVITGVSTAAGYGVGVAVHSMLASVSRRFTGGHDSVPVLLAVDTAAAGAGLVAGRALAWREHEEPRRAVGRLAATAVAAAGLAGLGSVGAGVVAGHRTTTAMLGLTAATGVGAWLATRPRKAAPGSLVAPNTFFEDDVREVKPAVAAGIGVLVTGVSYGLARGEAQLSKVLSRSAAVVMGGRASEHRMAGRVGATALTYGAGWYGVTKVAAKLSQGGENIEPAHSTPPSAPEITGSPASGVPWDVLSREGRRWLSMALTPAGIDAVMGTTGAKQPIRVYASLEGSPDPVARAQALLAEIDRTGALRRPVFALFSPTGSGYVNYVANETLEYLTGGDCASACVQYSVLPSSLSLTKVGTGVDQTRMVLDGIRARLAAMPADERPLFLLFGESLGSQVSEEVFRDTGLLGLESSGIDSAIWIGTPDATVWRRQIWGERSIAEVPAVGPGSVYLPRSIADWRALPADQREGVRYLLLMNGDDPIPKFGSEVVWRRPAWLGPEQARPIGSPKGSTWTPVSTFFATFIDMMNALTPTPGVFAEGGHDYREVLPETIREVWRFTADDDQMARIQAALRTRERAWELHRRWSEAQAQTGKDGDKARAKVLATLATWEGVASATPADVERVIAEGLQPMPAAGADARGRG